MSGTTVLTNVWFNTDTRIADTTTASSSRVETPPTSEPAAGLEPGVVYERHYALNWLTKYGDVGWDNVPTDT